MHEMNEVRDNPAPIGVPKDLTREVFKSFRLAESQQEPIRQAHDTEHRTAGSLTR